MQQPIAFECGDFLRHGDDVIARVTPGRQRHIDAEDGAVVRLEAGTEARNLRAAVVDIPLSVQRVAGGDERVGERVDDDDVAAGADGGVACRICAAMFDLRGWAAGSSVIAARQLASGTAVMRKRKARRTAPGCEDGTGA